MGGGGGRESEQEVFIDDQKVTEGQREAHMIRKCTFYNGVSMASPGDRRRRRKDGGRGGTHITFDEVFKE